MIPFSLDLITTQARNSLKRFPIALLIALFATINMLILTDTHVEDEVLAKLILASWITFPFQLALYLRFPNEKWVHLPGFLLLGILYWAIGTLDKENNALRIFIFGLITHICVAIAPYIKKNTSLLDFWYFNLLLFQRILLSIAFSFIIALGLTLAVLSLKSLFGLHIGSSIYTKIWVLSYGLFNTWMFVSGIPEQSHIQEQTFVFPKHFELLTRFVLIPLVLIYLTILYAYILKIGIQMELPKGWVTWLFLTYSVAGIFTFLLVWPLSEQENQEWIQKYARYFYFALVPLLAVEFIAIGVRISQYGFTELRLVVLILSLWLSALVVYFAFLRQHDIRVIPISLALVAGVSVIGPWSIFSMSYYSQQNRLVHILEETHTLEKGLITPKPISDSLKVEINSILTYLGRNHNLEEVISYFPKNEQDSLHTFAKEKWGLIGEIRKKLGTDVNLTETGSYISFSLPLKNCPTVSVSGFDSLQSFYISSYDLDSMIQINSDSLKLTYLFENQKYTIGLDSIYQTLLQQYKKTNQPIIKATEKQRTVEGTQANHRYKLFIQSATLTEDLTNNSPQQIDKRIDNIQGLLLVKKNK